MAISILNRVKMLDEFRKKENKKKSLKFLAQLTADLLHLKSVPSKNTISKWKNSEETLRQQASATEAMFPGPI